MSTFAELTSLAPAALSPTHSQVSHEFRIFVKDLDFDESPQEVITESAIEFESSGTSNDSDQSLSESSESEDDEGSDPTYRYEKGDRFRGLEERVKERISTYNTEVDKEFEELVELAKLSKRKLLQPGTKFTPGSIFTCVMCAKSFPTAEKLQEHTDKAHDLSENRHKCKICSKSYKYKKNLKAHMTIHSKEFQCSDCQQIFQSAAALDTHIAKYHQKLAEEIKIVMKECDLCKGEFPEEAIVRHIWYCKNKEKIAAKMTTSSPALQLKTCATPSFRDKSCQICGENFASRQSMIRHVGRKHPEAKNDPNVTKIRYVSTESPSHAYACQDCGKRLTTRAALTQHRARAHLDSTRHKCHLCEKAYTLPSELTKHVKRVHEAIKPKERGQLPDHDDICKS